MTSAQTPAGWYRDPSARHEQRFWDGSRWSSQVVDGGVVLEDPPASLPVTAGFAPGYGYRAVAVAMWRRVLVAIAIVALVVAFVFELIATGLALGTRTITTDESWLWTCSWLYKPLSTTFGTNVISRQMYVGYAPILLGISLIAALVFAGYIYVGPYVALKKAGARGAPFWASPEVKLRWSLAVNTLGLARLHLFRTSYRAWLVLAEVSALVIIFVSANAILGRAALTTTLDTVTQLKVGLGPWVCLSAGIISAVGFFLAWPFTRQRTVLIRPDGTVEDLPPA